MDKAKETSSKKFRFPYSDSDSDSESETKSETQTSSESSSDDSEEESQKSTINTTPTDKKIIIRKLSTNTLTKQINSMKFNLLKLLKTKKNHECHIKQFNKTELKTIKNVILSVKQLKQVRCKQGFEYLPKSTIKSFKKCKSEIEDLFKKNKKKDMQNSILSIAKKDNFASLRNILTSNATLYRINKNIMRKSQKN